MSRHDAPDAADLVSVVAELLSDEVLGAVTGDLRWQVRIAANVLRIVARELREDPAVDAAYAEGLRSFGFPDDAALAAAIRDGSMRHDEPALRALVTAGVEARLRVSRPV